MTLVIVGGIVLLLGVTVVVLRALNRIDDVYNRLPHDRDLQELFRHHMKRAQKIEEELTRWVLTEADPDSLMKVYGLRDQEALDTALGLCCLFGLGPPVIFLIEQGARFDFPLCESAPEIICGLVRKRGIVVREMDLQGSTALHLCALCGHPELTETLCKLGADPSRKNNNGLRPLNLVSQCSSSNCVCISNKLWSFGCRTVRTRRILRCARWRQVCIPARLLIPSLFDCVFGDGYVATRTLSENGDGHGESRIVDLSSTTMQTRRLSWRPLLSMSCISVGLSLALGLVWGDISAGRNLLGGWGICQAMVLGGGILGMVWSAIGFLASSPGVVAVLDEPTSDIPPLVVNGASRDNVCLAAGAPVVPTATGKTVGEREQDKRVLLVETQWKQAKEAFEAEDYQAAVALYKDMAAGMLRWLDQERYRLVRTRQRDCYLRIAEQLATKGRHVDAVKWFCDALAEHSETLTREHMIQARLARDRSIVAQLRAGGEAEVCADMHAALSRLAELPRPACVDATTWAAWKRRDRSVLAQLLEGRMELVRDLSKGGSPALQAVLAKLDTALKACDKIGGSSGDGLGDCVDLAVEALFWMVESCEMVAGLGHDEASLASCKRGIELAESALKLIELDPHHCRHKLCKDTLARLQKRSLWQLSEQEREAAEALEVQRVLDEQRRLEEEERALKKAQQEEKAKRAREERLRREQERKQQQLQEKEEALRKKAEEVATRKREAEERRRKDEILAQQEEAERQRRESEERRKLEAQERALAQAIAEAKARKEAQERERERDKERERERAAREQGRRKQEERRVAVEPKKSRAESCSGRERGAPQAGHLDVGGSVRGSDPSIFSRPCLARLPDDTC